MFSVMGRFRDRISVRGYNIQCEQYKNPYFYYILLKVPLKRVCAARIPVYGHF